MGLTTSAAEQNLKALESRLGHALLDSEGGALHLTLAGERTYEALDLLGEALESSATPSPSPAIRLTLGANPQIFGHLRERLAAFEEAHEDVGIDLDLDCFTAAAVRRKIAAGMVDIAYYYALSREDALEPDEPGTSTYAWTERLSLFIGTRHPLATRDLVTRDDMALTPPLLLAADNPLRPMIDTLMAMAGFGAAPPACESDDYGQLLDHVRAGDGFLALFGPLAQQFGALKGVKRLPYAEMLPSLDVRRALASGDNQAARLLATRLD